MRLWLEDTAAGIREHGRGLVGRLEGAWGINYPNDIFIYNADFDSHHSLVTVVFARRQAGGLSVIVATSKWCCASLESVGMVVDRQGVRPAESKPAAVAELTTPTTVEELRAFLGMTGYLRQYVEHYIISAAPLTDILRNPASTLSCPSSPPWSLSLS